MDREEERQEEALIPGLLSQSDGSVSYGSSQSYVPFSIHLSMLSVLVIYIAQLSSSISISISNSISNSISISINISLCTLGKKMIFLVFF